MMTNYKFLTVSASGKIKPGRNYFRVDDDAALSMAKGITQSGFAAKYGNMIGLWESQNPADTP